MAFSSLRFLFGFLPLFVGLYYAAPSKLKNLVALLASCLFYSWGAANVFGILVVGLVIDYVLANWIGRIESDDERARRLRRLLLGASVATNVGALAYYKYSNFFVAQLDAALKSVGVQPLGWTAVVLPIGISFFTFHKISYVVDVYRKVSPPAKSFVTFALYVLFFPQLIAGPIIRYHDVAEQLISRTHPLASVGHGAFRFCIGLGKKVLIANQLASTADLVFAQQPATLSVAQVWLGVLCYTFQIYFDFSGYSDMALGLGKMFGIHFKENFDCPYRALSITDFGGAGTFPLSSWMKEYLYVSLGGNRVGRARMYLNLWIVFLLSGLWHGANWTFVVWGAYHGTFLVLEKLVLLRLSEALPRVLRVSLTFLVVVVGWVFFRSPELAYATDFLGRMAALTHYAPLATTPITAELLTNRGAVALFVAAVLSFAPAFDFGARAATRYGTEPTTWQSTSARYLGALSCLVLSCASLANSGYNPFIYFRF